MNTFKASGNAGSTFGKTAKEAALAYFEEYPKSRKCDVSEGIQDGIFFTIAYGIGKKSPTIRDVTKKQAMAMEE